MSLNTKHDPRDSIHPAPNFPQIKLPDIYGTSIGIIDIWGPYALDANESHSCYVQIISMRNGFAHLSNPFLIGSDINSEGCFVANIPNAAMSSGRGTLSNAIKWISSSRKPNDRHPSYQQWMNTEWEIHQHLKRVVQRFC